MASYSLLVEQVLTEVDLILKNYVYDGYQALTSYLEVPLGCAIVLFYVIYGIYITQGWTKGSVSGFVKSASKVGLIYYFGMNWGHFSEYVYTLFYDVAGHIGDVLVSASPIELPTLGGTGINGALQSIYIELMKIGQWIMDAGSFSNWGPFFGGLGVLISGWLMVGYAILETIIAKVMLSVLFVTAPLFIAFTMFKPTQSFFDRWLGACVGYSLLMIFICTALGIVVSLDQWALAAVYASKALDMRWIDVGVVILVTFVCFGILRRVALLATSIGGTVTTMSSNELVAGAVGGAVSSAMSVKNATRMVASIASGPMGVVAGAVKTMGSKGSSVAKGVMKNLRSGNTPGQ